MVSSQERDWTCVHCIDRWILNHWTTRGVQFMSFCFPYLLYICLTWERLKARGEGDNRGWDGWMASLTQWTWVWTNSGNWWWTGKPGMLQSIGSQSWTWLSDRTDWLNTVIGNLVSMNMPVQQRSPKACWNLVIHWHAFNMSLLRIHVSILVLFLLPSLFFFAQDVFFSSSFLWTPYTGLAKMFVWVFYNILWKNKNKLFGQPNTNSH